MHCLNGKTSMVTIIEALILAIIQGLTEWLPVSSSGHLVIAQQFLGLNPPLIFDLILHIGTLGVVLISFRKDILKILKALVKKDLRSDEGKLAFFIIVGSVPIAVIGFIFKENIVHYRSFIHDLIKLHFNRKCCTNRISSIFRVCIFN